MTNQACVTIIEKYRLALRLLALAFALTICALLPVSPAEAACAVPNQITNGQPADATAVMGNFDALKNCADAAVAPSGTPVAGNLSIFSGPKSVTSGDLSGDCTTSGGLAVTCAKSNGTPLGHFATGTDAGQLTGTISVNRFNNGVNADSSHFLRGDGVWAIPTGGSGGSGGGGGFVSTAPALSWRIIFPLDVSNYSGATYSGFAEIEWQDSDGTVLSTGGTAVASAQLDGNWPQIEAFDGFKTTGDNGWLNTLASSKLQWIAYTKGSVWLPSKVVVWPPFNYATSFPTKFVVQFSNDGGIYWSSVGLYSTTTPVAGTAQTIIL